MTLRDHTILGGLAGAALYPVMGVNALWFFGASVLIDIDHYLDFIYHNKLKDFSPSGMFRYHETLTRWWQSPEFMNMEVFHTAEFLVPLLVIALALGSGVLRAVFFGCIFHIGLDVIFLAYHGITGKRIHSAAAYFSKKKALARKGLYTERLYERAVDIVLAEKTGRKRDRGPLKEVLDIKK